MYFLNLLFREIWNPYSAFCQMLNSDLQHRRVRRESEDNLDQRPLVAGLLTAPAPVKGSGRKHSLLATPLPLRQMEYGGE